MSELKAITVINAYQLECNDNDLVYLKSDVDTVLAEYDEKIRRLKRALWLARAERAKDRATTCNDFAYLGDTERDINMTLARTWMK